MKSGDPLPPLGDHKDRPYTRGRRQLIVIVVTLAELPTEPEDPGENRGMHDFFSQDPYNRRIATRCSSPRQQSAVRSHRYPSHENANITSVTGVRNGPRVTL